MTDNIPTEKMIPVKQVAPRISPLVMTIITACMVFVFISLFTLPSSQVLLLAKVGWAGYLTFWTLFYYVSKISTKLYNKLMLAETILAEVQRQANGIMKKARKEKE